MGIDLMVCSDYCVPMTNNHFLNVARSLAKAAEESGHSLNAYAVLNITDALIKAGVNFAEPEPTDLHNYFGHERYVREALADHNVMDYVRANKKINAIKELRGRTGCGLKEAKEAVEDMRVWGAAPRF